MFTVMVRSPGLIEDTPVGAYRSLYMDLRLMAAGGSPSVATLEIPTAHPAVAALLRTGTGPGHPQAGMVVRRTASDKVVFSGRVVDLDDGQGPGGTTSLIFSGDDSILAGDITFPSPATDVSSVTTTTMAAAYDTRTGPGETALLAFIAANIGAAAGVARRRYPWLIIPSPHPTPLGTSGTWKARFGDLLTLCRRIAVASGIAWRLVQIGQGQIGVEVWDPATAPTARFSPGSGSMTDVHYRWQAPRTDETIIGGSGGGTARVLTRRDAPGVANGLLRTVRFVDQQSTSTLSELQQAGDEQLADDAPTAGIQFTAQDRPGRQFGIDYQLGDVATAVDARGFTVNDVIQQVEITHEASGDGGIASAVVRPTVGAVNAQDSTDLVKRVLRLIDATVRS